MGRKHEIKLTKPDRIAYFGRLSCLTFIIKFFRSKECDEASKIYDQRALFSDKLIVSASNPLPSKILF